MDLMLSRRDALLRTIEALRETGVYFMEASGQGYQGVPADDMGLYYFVPNLVRAFGLSLDQAVAIFFGTIIGVSFLAGLIGFWKLARKPATFVMLLPAYLMLLALTWYSWDVYAIQSSAVVALLPLFILFLEQREKKTFLVFLFLAGLVAGYANMIRAHAGTVALVFITVVILRDTTERWRRKAGYILLLLAGLIPSTIQFSHLLSGREEFLKRTDPAFEGTIDRHFYATSIFIGLGFINNPFDLEGSDQNAMQRVQSISPGTKYLSLEFNRILGREVLKTVRRHRFFVLQTLAAKAGVVLMYLLVFANIALVVWSRFRETRRHTLAFLVAMSFAALNCVLVSPFFVYALGFIALATLFGSLTIIEARKIGRPVVSDLPRLTLECLTGQRVPPQ